MIVISKHQHLGLDNLPGSFAGLMDLYERNYIGIRRLVPQLPPLDELRTSQAPDSLPLYLRVTQRYRYTTELCLTYRFQKSEHCSAEPDLHIRIYHDARLAEVMSARLRQLPYFEAGDHVSHEHLRSRWHVNRFLYKWLNYCLHQGHRFGTA